MPEAPVGAIRTVEEAKEILKQAPHPIYRVSPVNFFKRIVTTDDRVTDNSGIIRLSYHHQNGFLDGVDVNIDGDNEFVFSNYWHALAFWLKVRGVE